MRYVIVRGREYSKSNVYTQYLGYPSRMNVVPDSFESTNTFLIASFAMSSETSFPLAIMELIFDPKAVPLETSLRNTSLKRRERVCVCVCVYVGVMLCVVLS